MSELLTLPQLQWQQLSDICDPEGFAGAYAGISGDTLLVAGGANFPEKPLWEGGPKVWHDSIFAYNKLEQSWSKVGTLPHPYAYGSSLSTPQGVFIIGGCDQNGHRKEVYLLNYDNNQLSINNFTPLPQPIANAAAAFVNNCLIIHGGSTLPGEKDALAGGWIYDLNHAELGWIALPQLPAEGRFLHYAASYHGDFYVFGGIGLVNDENGNPKRKLLGDAWHLDMIKMEWERLADMPHPMAAGPTPVPIHNNCEFCLFAGDDGSRAGFTPIQEHPGFAQKSLMFYAKYNVWVPSEQNAAPRAVLPCVEWDGYAWFINGELRPGKRSNQIWGIKLND